MYRVIDTPGIFGLLAERDFGQTCRLKLTLEDSFLPQNAGDYYLRFEGGRVSVENGGETDVQLGMDVADFSSLLVGAVNLRSLYRYGLARVSEPGYVDVLDKIFAVRDKPICTTAF
jgi:predicted acetyltransferase